MQSIKINCTEARKIDLVTYLENLNIHPKQIKGNDYWYLSPFRNEQTPSFKINRKLNVWYDHGIGKGGNIIDFGMIYYNCTVADFLKQLQDQSFSFQALNATTEQLPQEVIEKKIKMVSAKPISNHNLCRYLQNRAIPLELAKKYCHEVTYQNGEKEFYAIGFKNNSGGFELRSADFKSTIAPKDFTFFDNQTEAAVAVFEGFTDFLSLLAKKQNILPELSNFLVLNSLNFFEKARPLMEQHEKVYLLLDNDAPGKNCAKRILALSPKYQDLSNKYEEHKDLNDWLVKERTMELQQIPCRSFRR